MEVMKKSFFKEMLAKDITIKNLNIRFTPSKEAIKDQCSHMSSLKSDLVCLN
jgi:hypothetical protein